MKAVLLNFATAKEDWAEKAIELYTKKISHFIKFETITLKSKNFDRKDAELKIKKEEEVLLDHLSTDDWVVLFDEKGKSLDSIKFSAVLEKGLTSGKKRMVFIIGGAYGVSEQIKAKANITISLSMFTFNHLVAETVALEQIYRGFTILKRIPYHNE